MLKSKIFTVLFCAVMSFSGVALADEGNPHQAEPRKALGTASLDRVLARETGILMRLNLSAEQEQQINEIRRAWALRRAEMVRYRSEQRQALEALKAAEEVDPGKVKDLNRHLNQVRAEILRARKATWVPLIQVLKQGQRKRLARILKAEFGAEYVAEVVQMVRAAVETEAGEPPADSRSPGEDEAARAEQERIEREQAERIAQAEAAEREASEREQAERIAQAERERHEAEQAERERAEREAAEEQAEGNTSQQQELKNILQAFEDLKRQHAALLKAFAELQEARNGGEGEPEAAPQETFEEPPAENIEESPEQQGSDK